MPQDTSLNRINNLSRAARTSFLSLMFVLVFVGVTLAGVTHADFFVPGRQTSLPLLGVEVPTMMFFIGAPTLCAALFANLHFHLQKLWSALSPSRLDANVKNLPVSETLTASFIADLALSLRGDGALATHRLQGLTALLTFLLLYSAAPLILIWMWWTSMFSLREGLTVLACGLPLVLTLHVGVASLQTLLEDTRPRKSERPKTRLRSAFSFVSAIWTGPRLRAAVLLVGISGLGWMRTEGTLDYYFTEHELYLGGPLQVVEKPWYRATPFPYFLSSPDLRGAVFVDLPEGWLSRSDARTGHRVNWCRMNELPLNICGSPHDEDEVLGRLRRDSRLGWCDANNIPRDDCPGIFAAFEIEQEADFLRERQLALSSIPRVDLEEVDLRGASLGEAILTRARMFRARLDNASLSGADLEDAKLARATLADAFLNEAQFEGANLTAVQMASAELSNALMDRADLSGAHMPSASMLNAKMRGASLQDVFAPDVNFRGADMTGAELSQAILFGADFSDTVMSGADLAYAQMEGADLSWANLEGADLFAAQMQRTRLHETNLKAANLQFVNISRSFMRKADFSESAGLTQDTIEQAYGISSGIGHTILPLDLTAPKHWPSEVGTDETRLLIEVTFAEYFSWLHALPPEQP